LAEPKTPWLYREFPSEIVGHADPVAMIASLRERYEGDVHLLGGPRTIATLMDLGGVDRLDVLIVPALFGEGLPLAQDPRARRDLKLESERRYEGGRPARPALSP
jgi:dihydrofolate reductase